MKRLVIYSREWRDEGVLKLYRAFSVLLQKHRVYVMEKVLELSPKRALVFTYPCGWHGDVLFLAPYVTAVEPFETSGAVSSPRRFQIVSPLWCLKVVGPPKTSSESSAPLTSESCASGPRCQTQGGTYTR